MKTVDKLLYFFAGMVAALVTCIAMVLASTDAISADAEWLCREQASEVHSQGQMVACGIASADSEPEAREKAYDAAVTEFNKTCAMNEKCLSAKVEATPKRTECLHHSEGFTCYRAVEFDYQSREARNEEVTRELTAIADQSRWTVYGGMLLANTKNQDVEVGYSLAFKYRLVGSLHLLAGATLGKVEYLKGEGSFGNLFTGLNLYVSSRVYLLGTVGIERQWGVGPTTNTTFGSAGLGIDVIKYRGVSLSIEGAAKIYQGGSVQPAMGAGFGFKF